MQRTSQYSHNVKSRSTAGFTLFELTILVAVIGIVGAIAAPAWNNFINRQRLNTAQNQVYRAMQAAKSNAALQKVTWQVSFRENNGAVQWAVHAAKSRTFIPPEVQWNTLDPALQVYKDKNKKGKCETTLDQQTHHCPTNGPWRVQFNYITNTNGQLGQITLTAKHDSNLKRCVYVSTLIGTMRTGQEHSKPNKSEKYCY
jgi:Tfp pilus assembly protein FimT